MTFSADPWPECGVARFLTRLDGPRAIERHPHPETGDPVPLVDSDLSLADGGQISVARR